MYFQVRSTLTRITDQAIGGNKGPIKQTMTSYKQKVRKLIAYPANNQSIETL